MQSIQSGALILLLVFTLIAGEQMTPSTCGQRLPDHNAFMAEAPTIHWPWHAAIYHQGDKPGPDYKCGGTVINSKLILTVAHCVAPLGKGNISVTLGRLNLDVHESSAQYFKVSKIVLHPNYTSIDDNLYNHDIAIIVLASDATFNNYVRPICLWDSNNLELSEVFGRKGTVVSWGATEMVDKSKVLRQALVPVVPLFMCLDTELVGPLSATSFCAGSRNGTRVCNGDSGGSIFFEENGLYYIRGIVSAGTELYKEFNDKICDSSNFAIFTDVAQYLPWIDEVMNNMDAIIYPWHAVIYHHYENSTGPVCGGSLISKNLILTAAHCVTKYYNAMEAKEVSVALGRVNIGPNESSGQFLVVAKIIPHPNYSFVYLNDNIAIIQLSTEVTFNNYVQPVCLWPSNRLDISEVIGKVGTAIGFGGTETGKTLQELKHFSMPVVSTLTCLASNRNFFGIYLTATSFCAGFRNGTVHCLADSGGSMTFEENGTYYIRGIASLSAAKRDSTTGMVTCDDTQYSLFTDVAPYLPFINYYVAHLSMQESKCMKT